MEARPLDGRRVPPSPLGVPAFAPGVPPSRRGVPPFAPGVPAFAPGVRAHLLRDERVLVLGGRERVVLRGRAHSLVVPLIDGRSSDQEIAAALAGALPAAVVALALRRLADRRLIARVEPGSAPLAPPPVHPGDEVLERYAIPAAGEFRCVGVGVSDAIVSALTAAVGARVEAGGSRSPAPFAPRGLTVIVVDDYLRAGLDRLAARCRAQDTPLLPIRSAGRDWWFGPYCDGAAAAPMWSLFRARLRGNRRDDLDSLQRGATFPLYGEDSPQDGVLGRGIAYAAVMIDQVLRGEPPTSVVDCLLALDARDGESTEHEIAIIAASVRRDVPAFGESLPPVHLAPERQRRPADGGHRAATPQDTLGRLAPLISPITGLVAGLERLPALEGTHVYATTGTLVWQDLDGGARAPTFREGALGKGLTDVQARVSCIGEAIELAAASFTGDEPRRRARWSEVEQIAIHPRGLLLFSDDQRAGAGRQAPDPTWDTVPAPLDECRAIEWVPLVSLVSGATRWLPAAYCYFGYADAEYPAPLYAIADANGCAAGNTVAEAILQGLLELIERDATALWWYSRAGRPGIDLESFADVRLTAIRDAHAALGRTLAILDLRSDTGVTVAAAVAWDRIDGTVLPTGRGCHLDPAIAVLRAVTELSQVSAVCGAADRQPAHRATIGERPFLVPDSSPPVRAADLVDRSGNDVSDAIDWCVRILAGLGHDVLVLDTTRPELGLDSVRVVVPGLRPLLRRLAPGRLYDVPAALGWVPRKLREDELNPEAFVS